MINKQNQNILTRQQVQPSLLKRGEKLCKMLIFFLLITTVIASIGYFAEQEPSNNTLKCNGKGEIQNPSNTTFYRYKLLEPRIESYSKLEQTLLEELPHLRNRFHTVIFDCPESVAPHAINYTLYNYAFVKALAEFNKVHSPPIKFWLRLDKRADASANFTYCTELAILGNKISPGTVQGVLGNSEILLAYAAIHNITYHYKTHRPPCKWYSESCFDLLNAQGLKFGLLLHSIDCQVLPRLAPHSIIRRFDEIFYFEEKHSQMTIGRDKIPTLTVSDDFNKCKNLVAGLVPRAKPVKYVIAEMYQVHQPWKISPYPYCLQFV